MSAARGGGDVTTGFDGTDIDGDPLTYKFTTDPADGTIINNNNGTFSYTPNASGSSTVITVNYTATDSHNVVSKEGVITIEIVSLNTAPVAENLELATDEDSGLAGKLPVTDAEDASENLVYDILTQPTAGKLILLKDGAFLFDPLDDFQDLAAGESATVTFTYQATDPGGLASNIATVEITIAGVNDAPSAEPVEIAAFEDGPAVTGNFLGDDVDSDDDPGTLDYDDRHTARRGHHRQQRTTAASPLPPAPASRTWRWARPVSSPSPTRPPTERARLRIPPPASSPSPERTTRRLPPVSRSRFRKA